MQCLQGNCNFFGIILSSSKVYTMQVYDAQKHMLVDRLVICMIICSQFGDIFFHQIKLKHIKHITKSRQ